MKAATGETSTQKITLDFVGIGASRSGTTWFARCLGEHPEIFLPPRKELHYFNSDEKYRSDLSSLSAYFADAPAQTLRGEFTPRYFINATALQRIKHHFPRIKVLLLLRNPIDRSFSQYLYFRFNKRKEAIRSYREAVRTHYHDDYIAKSCYAQHVARVFDIFEREEVCITIYEEAQEDPEYALQRVFTFLGVSSNVTPPSLHQRINPSRSEYTDVVAPIVKFRTFLIYTRSPLIANRLIKTPLLKLTKYLSSLPIFQTSAQNTTLSDEDRYWAYEQFFKEDIEALESLLNRNLSIWKPTRP